MGRPKQYQEYVPQIVHMYTERNLSLSEIQDITGISQKTVSRILLDKQIKLRPRGHKKGTKIS